LQGTLDVVYEDSGKGVPVWGHSLGDLTVGSAPGAQTRGALWVPLPRAGNRVRAVYLSIGVVTPRDLRVPLRWRLAVDSTSIAREFRPQLSIDTDHGVYHKAIYDIRPVMARKIMEKDDHRVLVIYDALHPIRIVDVFMFGVFENEDASYSVSYRSGAVALAPGEVYKADMSIGQSFGGARKAGVIIHSPNPDAVVEVVAGGSRPYIVEGSGSYYAEVQVPYKGSPVPFSVKYRLPPGAASPKIVIATEMVASEVKAPSPSPVLHVESAKRSGKIILVEGWVENRGDGPLEGSQLIAIALGVQLARKRLPRVEPGGRMQFRLRLDASRLPLEPKRVSIRLIWRQLGKTRLEMEEVELE